MRKVLETYLMWTPKKGMKRKEQEGGSRPTARLRPLYRARSCCCVNWRSATVGQPPVQTAVGRLPPLPLAVGVCRAGHVAGHRSAVGRGSWRPLTAICNGDRILPPLQTAVGTQPSFEMAVRGYFCQC
jgi:hypothetical protein